MSQYPPLGFYFQVSFTQTPGVVEPVTEEVSFQSVSGLTSEVVTETYKEGGQNQFEYELPVKTQYPDLVLKRGLWVPKGNTAGNDLRRWCQRMMENLQVEPSDLTITLMNPSGAAWMRWEVVGAWPKKWSIADFNAEQNEVVIESMEFSYFYFKIT